MKHRDERGRRIKNGGKKERKWIRCGWLYKRGQGPCRPIPRPKWAGQGRAGGGPKRPLNSWCNHRTMNSSILLLLFLWPPVLWLRRGVWCGGARSRTGSGVSCGCRCLWLLLPTWQAACTGPGGGSNFSAAGPLSPHPLTLPKFGHTHVRYSCDLWD